MARTANASISIRNNGTPLGSIGFTTLDLTGSISATDEGAGVANVTAAGGASGTNVATQVLTAVQSGNNVTIDLTTAAHTVVAVEVVFRNGQGITPSVAWSLSGSTITILNADASEVFMVQYTW